MKKKQYKVGALVTIKQTPQILHSLINKTAIVEWVNDKEMQLRVSNGGMLVLSFDEIKNKVFKIKKSETLASTGTL